MTPEEIIAINEVIAMILKALLERRVDAKEVTKTIEDLIWKTAREEV